MSKKDLKKAVYRLRELEAQAGEIAQEIDMLKDAIKAEMTAQNVTEMQVDVFHIRWASVQSCRFDSAAFQACYAGPVRQLPSADGNAPVLGTMKNPPAKLR